MGKKVIWELETYKRLFAGNKVLFFMEWKIYHTFGT